MWTVREERASDHEAITKVTLAAFENHPISHQTEPFIIQHLRASRALAISLVAEVDGRVVGHIAFSPVEISDGSSDWYALGPLSVLPKYQRQGIGAGLVREGLSSLKRKGGRGCVLVGDFGFYERFGFKNHSSLIHKGIPQEVFLALPFTDHLPEGFVTFHKAFLADRPA